MPRGVWSVLLVWLCCVGRAFGGLPDFHIDPEFRRNATGFAPPVACLSQVRSVAATPADCPDAARYDRILVSRVVPPGAAELVCLPAGGNVPLWTSRVLRRPVGGVLWLWERLLVWSDRQVALLRAEDGASVWVNDVGPRPADDAGRPDEASIIYLRLTSKRLIVVTSDGGVVALDRASGRVAWGTRLAAGSIEQLLGNERFVVLRLENGPSTDLVVYQTASGGRVGGKAEPLVARGVINAALSADDVLVWTGAETITAVDIGGATPRVLWQEKPGFPTGGFEGFDLPGQLSVVGDRVFTVYRALTSAAYTLSSWPVRGDPPVAAKEVAIVSGRSPRLRAVAPDRLLIVTVAGITSLSLTDRRDLWTGIEPMEPARSAFHVAADGLLVGTDYVVLGGQIEDRHRPPTVILAAYTRGAVDFRDRRESGRLDFLNELPLAAGTVVRQWAGADGGIYYLASDGVLYFLRGLRP